MNYFFILGRNADISVAEIFSVLQSLSVQPHDVVVSRDALVLNTASELPLSQLQARLGGTIKTGVVLEDTLALQKIGSSEQMLSEIFLRLLSNHNGRLTLGLSAYTLSQETKKVIGGALTSKTLKSLGLKIKRLLRDQEYSVRFVAAEREPFLSSVQVSKNGLLEDKGKELVFFVDGSRVRIGVTHITQEFEEYSFRDWQRPHRGMDIGILPPKLAQIMLNLTRLSPQDAPTLLDPFCGFGSILQEALLMGYSNVFGSDLKEENVQMARNNISWLMSKKGLSYNIKNISVCDATQLGTLYKKASINAIITEPFLGPVVTRDFKGSLKKISDDLSTLYLRFFSESKSILVPQGVVSCVFPAWQVRHRRIRLGRKKHDYLFLPILEKIEQLGFKNVTLLPEYEPLVSRATPRKTLLYSRPEQHVARELIVFQKTS
ncbi:hypothetical protein HY620_00055 [Candidatus Uhrbacteria bacterium]|nr:hypothetical protein [Candidatus Uhrbacteria bacterium]